MATNYRFVEISIDGQPEFLRGMARIGAVWNDLTPIWGGVRTWFYGIEAQQFGSEGSAGANGSWPGLSERYKIQKIKRYGDKPILVASGLLKGSLTGDNPGSVFRTTKTTIELGTEVPYGIHHQRGGGKLPRRKIMDFSAIQKRDLQQVIQIGLIKELRSGGNYQVPVTDG